MRTAGPVVRALRDLGHDVSWAKEDAVGAADWLLLARAQAEQRIIVTCDTDFGELAFHSGLPAASGVILLRITWTGLEADNRRIIAAVTSRNDWAGHFIVVEDDRVRVRAPPSTNG